MHSRIQLFFSVVISTLFLFSCGAPDQQLSEEEHAEKVNQWHEDRVKSLKKEDSWLSLAGLYKLQQGRNSIGADSSNNIVFPPGSASNAGVLTVSDNTFRFEANPNVTITHNGQKVSTQELKSDAEGTPTRLWQDSLLWYVIKRRDDFYIRLKNTSHPNFDSFDGIDRFPVSHDWRIKATFERFDEPKKITIPDVLGIGKQETMYGTLHFTIDGKEYSLNPLGNPDTKEELFIIFGDQTNGESTYSGGRYLYVDTPDENGTTYIDFNKAYNPPCVFTHFATCPLPPAQNKLDLKITAGEKMYGDTGKAH